MNKTAYDLMPFLRDIETLKASSLSPAQKDLVLTEMVTALPAPVFCKACPETLAVIGSLLGVIDARTPTKRAEEEVPKEGIDPPKEGNAESKQLLHDTDAHGGRKSPPKAVVNKKAQKPGKAKGNS